MERIGALCSYCLWTRICVDSRIVPPSHFLVHYFVVNLKFTHWNILNSLFNNLFRGSFTPTMHLHLKYEASTTQQWSSLEQMFFDSSYAKIMDLHLQMKTMSKDGSLVKGIYYVSQSYG